MSVLFQFVRKSGKFNSIINTHGKRLNPCKCFLLRKFSDIPKKFESFDNIVTQRRAEARRSIVVQVNSESSFGELYSYCSKYAEINGIHHYRNAEDEHFMLIEFNSEENLKEILQNCSSHQKENDVIPLQSPFLWFRAVNGKKQKFTIPESKSLLTKDGNAIIDDITLFEELAQCKTVSEQIQRLYDRTVLNDLGVRLRYIVARQLEVILSSLYANIVVRPFGSSVNGFGKLGCDLDLVLTNLLTDEMIDPSKRLVYQEKKCEGIRGGWQRQLELCSELLALRVPGAARVVRILHARVPILKYTHEHTALHVDLCNNNISGVYMSELLWLLGSLDHRVRPLVFSVRHWARAAALTSDHPGRWLTNFPITLLVLFFLQQRTSEGVMLPTIKDLVSRAGKEDFRLAEDNIDCTFLRDANKLPLDMYGQSSADLQTLLMQFFEFYAQFNFEDKGISINEGVPLRKSTNSPLHIVNPLKQALNVSKNVSFKECERLKQEVRNAAWQLDSCLDNKNREDWGILSIIEKSSIKDLKKLLRVGHSHRLVTIKDLFIDSEEKSNSEEGLKSKLQRPGFKSDKSETRDLNENKEPRMKFKNSPVSREVYRIRRDKMV